MNKTLNQAGELTIGIKIEPDITDEVARLCMDLLNIYLKKNGCDMAILDAREIKERGVRCIPISKKDDFSKIHRMIDNLLAYIPKKEN